MQQMDQEMCNPVPFNMPPMSQQHAKNMMPFCFEMCPHPLGQNVPFMVPPQGQMMPFMPPHPAAQMHPHMIHRPLPVFEPQIIRDSTSPFVFRKKSSNQEVDCKQKQMKGENAEEVRKQVLYQVKQHIGSGNNQQQKVQNQSPLEQQEHRQQLNNYQPLRQTAIQKKNSFNSVNDKVKQKKIIPLQFSTDDLQITPQSSLQTPIHSQNMKSPQNLFPINDGNSQATNKVVTATSPIFNEKVEVKLPRQMKRKSVQKLKKKQIFVSSEKANQNKMKLRLKSNDQETNQYESNVQANQGYNALRSNRSKSPGIYQNQNSKSKYNQLKTNSFAQNNTDNFNTYSDLPINIQKMLSMPSQQNSKPLRILNRQSDHIFDYRYDKGYVNQQDMQKVYHNESHLKIHSPLKSQASYKSEQGYKQRNRKDDLKALTNEKTNFNNVFQSDCWNQAQPLSPFIPNARNHQFISETHGQVHKNSQILGDSTEKLQNVSLFNKSLSLSQSINHPMSANCLRKCTQWQLTLCDQIKNPAHNKQRIKPLVVSQNSGVALRQMNYHYEDGLTKEELNAKKQRIQIPSGPASFDYDIIDQMMMTEDQYIFDPYKQEFHAKHCQLYEPENKKKNNDKLNISQISPSIVDKNLHDVRDGPPEVDRRQKRQMKPFDKCCQPQLKQFNFYNQRSYINQPIQLPFDMNQINQTLSQQSAGAFSQLTDENFDLMSQISSQLSERSKTGSQFSQNNGGPSVKSSDTNCGMTAQLRLNNQKNQCNGIGSSTLQQYNSLHIREQMLQILNVQQAENMMCLEFDLQDYPIVLPENEKNNPEMIEQVQSNQRFRIINQSMIESMIHLRLKATCHGNTLFSPSEMTLNFNIQGKKLIKSIQDRILRLKEKLAYNVQQMQAQEMGASNKQYQQKYFLNMVEKNNRHGKGPWISQTKKSLVIKLLNFNGRSIAFQIAVPDLYNLPNLMTNFNQLVLREFIIEKIFVCFDMPLSKINSIQAQQIDVENYLTATKINSPYQNMNQARALQNQWILNSPASNFINDANNPNSSSQQNDMPSSSQGTPIMNLLNVYQEMKADCDKDLVDNLEINIDNQIPQKNVNTGYNDGNMHPIQTQINSIQPLKSYSDINEEQTMYSEKVQRKYVQDNNGTVHFDLLKPKDHLAHPIVQKSETSEVNKIQMKGVKSYDQQQQLPFAISTMNSTNSITNDERLQSDQDFQKHMQNSDMQSERFQTQQKENKNVCQYNTQKEFNPQGFGMAQMFYPVPNGDGHTFIKKMADHNQDDNHQNNLSDKGKNKQMLRIKKQKTQLSEQAIYQNSNVAIPITTINNYFASQENGFQMAGNKNMNPWLHQLQNNQIQQPQMHNQHYPYKYPTPQHEIMFGGPQLFMQGFMPQIQDQSYPPNENDVSKLPQAIQQEVQPGYYGIDKFLKEDRAQMCNLERLIVSTMPMNLNCQAHSLSDLIKAYHKVSTNGIQVEFFDDRSEKQSLMFTFTPTLSSIYLMTLSSKKQKSQDASVSKVQNQRVQKVIEFHEIQPHYKRKLLSHSILEHAKDLVVKLNKADLTSIDVSSSCSSYGSSTLQSCDSTDLINKKTKTEENSNVIEEDSINNIISTEFSWFSILWTCQRQQPLIKDQQNRHTSQGQQQSNDHSNVQFLVFYKFTENSSLEVIGMLSSKLDREAFWLTPGHVCENEIEGQLFDELYDSNIIRLQDMQEKCIKFMKDQGSLESSYDLVHILRGQQIESQSRERINDKFKRDIDGIDFNLQQVINSHISLSQTFDSQPLYNQSAPHHQLSGIHNLLMGDGQQHHHHQMIQNIPPFL